VDLIQKILIRREEEENNFEFIGPPVERWLDDPNQVKLEDCRTEIIIPIRKKGVHIL
jgi:effector-binding domain-containing protein